MNSLLNPTSSVAPAAGGPSAPVHAPPPSAAPVATDWFAWACPCCHATLRTLSTARRGNCPACGSFIEAPAPPAAAAGPAVAPPPTIASRPRVAMRLVMGLANRLASWSGRRWRALVLVGLTVTLAAGAMRIRSARPWTRFLGGSSSAPSTAPPPPEALREKLEKFLQAPDWAGKREHLLNMSQLDRLGAAYYQGRDRDEIKAADFFPWTMPGLSRMDGVTVLRAERPARRPVLAVFRQVDGDWRLDWELFSQTYDEALPTFLAAPSYPLRTFRTRLNRVFSDAPTDGTYAIQLSDLLDPGQRITVHLPTGTPIMRTIAGGLSGTAPRDATVEVCWARPDPAGEWVPMVQRLVCWGWDGLNGLPESAAPANPAIEHFITPSAAPHSSPPPPAENAVRPTATIASQ